MIQVSRVEYPVDALAQEKLLHVNALQQQEHVLSNGLEAFLKLEMEVVLVLLYTVIIYQESVKKWWHRDIVHWIATLFQC